MMMPESPNYEIDRITLVPPVPGSILLLAPLLAPTLRS